MSALSKTRKQKPFEQSSAKAKTTNQQASSPQASQIETVLEDYRIACLSRHVSIVGRREVLNGRAKFGAFSAGKELPQIAAARAFQLGDWRSGYYRNHTFTFALNMATPRQIFAQLYAHTDISADPSTGGRSMLGHHGTRLLDDQGGWRTQTEMYNSSADISPTAGQMPRLVGLAYASRLYRELDELAEFTTFSRGGSEVAFGTIGNASCAEGMFWESLNAIGQLQAPAIVSIYDDDYGISVPNEIQFTKGDIGPLLKGFKTGAKDTQGFNIYTVRGWDYPALIDAYQNAANAARVDHIPAIIHVTELTQQQGHSTSGSHERYKPAERIQWEKAHDPIDKMRAWIKKEKIATGDQLDKIDQAAKAKVEAECELAWSLFTAPLQAETSTLCELLSQAATNSPAPAPLETYIQQIENAKAPKRSELMQIAHQVQLLLHQENNPHAQKLETWRSKQFTQTQPLYSTHIHSQSAHSSMNIAEIVPTYSEEPETVPGFEILQANFDTLFAADPRICAFGEDVGLLGDVNQGMAGLQEKYGDLRVSDTGIRETTIIGQAIGMALRGLRPIAEIQYLDYILYAMSTISDDLATTQWRTAGGQKAPVIVRTRGHRLEGVWHSGSPMAALIHLLRGMYLLVPRNMTQAAGFYNLLRQSDEPALVIERLNAYRLHEKMPSNLGQFTTPLGVPETLRNGGDVTVVTYGACCDIALAAAETLQELAIEIEIIDVQSLLPFDIHHAIAQSVKKSSRVVFLDEDMPGGAAAYMMQQVLEVQGAYWDLDAEPRTITAPPHRPAYGSDGDYFCKPNVEDVVEIIYDLMHESDPQRYPQIWSRPAGWTNKGASEWLLA